MKFVPQHRDKIDIQNDTKHDRVCKSVTEIKDHAKNFPNVPRMSKDSLSYVSRQDHTTTVKCGVCQKVLKIIISVAW